MKAFSKISYYTVFLLLTVMIGTAYSINGNHSEFQGVFSDYQHYLEFYDIDFPSVEKKYSFHQVTTISNSYNIFVQDFRPEVVKGRVIFVHGFADHSGRQKYVMEYLLDRGYEVYLFDLPGHGMSSGERNGISAFREYAEVLHYVSQLIPRDGLPLHGVAHSTGGTAFLIYLQYFPDEFDTIILAAPLVFNISPVLSYAAYGIVEGSMETLPMPALPSYTMNDLSSKRLIKKDPLQSWLMHLSYVGALYKWQHTLTAYPVLDRPLNVIQGNRDNVVQWKDNMDFLRDHFKNFSLVFVIGGKHSLFMDHKWRREFIFRSMDEIFDAND